MHFYIPEIETRGSETKPWRWCRMKIRAQTLVAGLAGGATPMNKIGAKGFYVKSAGGMWWSKKPVIIANLPYTIESPHVGQIETRIHFAEVASKTRGMPLAERLEVMRRELTGYRAPDAMNPADYPSKQSYHTVDQLKAMLAKKKGAPVSYGAYGV